MHRLFSVFVCLVLVQTAFGLYGKNSNVIALNKKNFAESVFSSEHVWVVEFFAPWCGHCKQLAPEYEKAATNLKGIVKVGAVDCDVEKELCGSFEVKGFPTLKIFPSKSVPVPKKKDAFHKVPEDYQGGRTAAAIANFALTKLPSFVSSVTSANHDKFLGETLPKAILFTNKDKTSDLYKALSIDYHHRFALGETKHTDKKLVEKYGITAFPTLLILAQEEGGEHIKFEGKLSHDSLSKFLEPHAVPIPKQEKKGKAESEPEPQPQPQREPETGEIFLVKDQAFFDEKCVNKGGLCALIFLDYNNFEQDEIDRYINILTSLGVQFKGKLRLFYLDGPAQPALSNVLDLSANYPNAVVLSTNKKRYTPFKGSFTEEALADFFSGVLLGRPSFAYTSLAITPFVPPPPKPVYTEEPEDKDEL
jgi:protein disulfide-isomerase A6